MYSCPGAACTVSVMYVCGGGGGRGGEGRGGGRLTVYSCPGAACTVSVFRLSPSPAPETSGPSESAPRSAPDATQVRHPLLA